MIINWYRLIRAEHMGEGKLAYGKDGITSLQTPSEHSHHFKAKVGISSSQNIPEERYQCLYSSQRIQNSQNQFE